MQFINPLYLFGLLAVAIPVIIHLFNFRRFRKVYFTNVRFIRELKNKTQKQSQFRHLLILAMRILAIAALVFAFAQPYLPYSSKNKKLASQNVVSVYVDNSFSMEAVGESGSLLDEAKQKAREVVSAYKSSDLFQLLSTDFEGRQQRLVTKDEFLTMLNELKISPAARTLPEIVTRQDDLLHSSPSSRKTAYMISDFQKSLLGAGMPKPDSAIQTYLIPLKTTPVPNVYIDTCWFSQPTEQAGSLLNLNVRVWNKSEADLEKIPLKLEINKQQKSVAALDIKAGKSIVLEMPFTIYKPGLQKGVLQVTDFPIVFDNTFYFSFDVVASVSVADIHNGIPNRFIQALFARDSAIKYTPVNQNSIDYKALQGFDLIILDELTQVSSGLSQEIKRFVDNGGSLFIVPAPNPDLNSYNSMLSMLQSPQYQRLDTASTKVVKINSESYLFKDVFEIRQGKPDIGQNIELPDIKKHFTLTGYSTMLTIPLMSTLNGHNFLTVTSSGLGQVFQMAVPIDPAFSNFQNQALFVPVMYNAAIMSHPSHNLYNFIGDNKSIRISNQEFASEQAFKIRSETSAYEVIPQVLRSGNAISLFVGNQITEAGNYNLMNTDKIITGLSFNYNRIESDVSCYNENELTSFIEKAGLNTFEVLKTGKKPVNEVIAQITSGIQLWKYFIWLALLFLLAEVLLIRFKK